MNVEIGIDRRGYNRFRGVLHLIYPQAVYKAANAAASRALTAARTAGSRKIRQIYTVKAGKIKQRVTIKRVDGGAEMRIKGPMEDVSDTFKWTKGKYGGFAIIKKGERIRIPHSFTVNERFLRRTTPNRYPLKGIWGPAVPQLFGNPEVVAVMQQRGEEVFMNRLEHEIFRRV